jgi:signal transduction histidine kinase
MDAAPNRLAIKQPRRQVRDGEARPQARDLAAELRLKERQLRAMSIELLRVEKRERSRLAGVLHHHVQQLLLSARLHLNLLNQGQMAADERDAFSKADEALVAAMSDCRSLAVDLSPPILLEAGLGAALGWLAARMHKLHGFTINLDVDHTAGPQTRDMRVILFEIVRELLLNSCKHSGCSSARVSMARGPNRSLSIVVQDGGKGFDPEALTNDGARGEKLGLLTIQERLAHLGGQMELHSTPGAGTRIRILAPVSSWFEVPLVRNAVETATVQTHPPGRTLAGARRRGCNTIRESCVTPKC